MLVGNKIRLVVDYRKLNEKTAGNAYPLPDITETLDQRGQAKYFSCLYLAMGYHKTNMDPHDMLTALRRDTGRIKERPLG
jgi:hypothetical protein